MWECMEALGWVNTMSGWDMGCVIGAPRWPRGLVGGRPDECPFTWVWRRLGGVECPHL